LSNPTAQLNPVDGLHFEVADDQCRPPRPNARHRRFRIARHPNVVAPAGQQIGERFRHLGIVIDDLNKDT
jgi:hypothetical protein